MTELDANVTLAEVNRNLMKLSTQVENMSRSYVLMTLWEENRKYVGERIGAIENELAERRRAFTNSFLYPLLIALSAGGIGFVLARLGG